LTAEQKHSIDDPIEMEGWGLNHLVFHAPATISAASGEPTRRPHAFDRVAAELISQRSNGFHGRRIVLP
jgi:hypothetical protein